MVHTEDGIIKFKQEGNLYYYNFPETYLNNTKKNKKKKTGVQFIEIVQMNRDNYTTKQYQQAKKARKLYNIIDKNPKIDST